MTFYIFFVLFILNYFYFLAENPRLKIPISVDVDNHLIEELRFLDHPLCEIEKVHNLINDNVWRKYLTSIINYLSTFFVYCKGLTHIDDIVSRKAMP